MFFVVILIIVAFGTIFGSDKFKHLQRVPQILLFAILINFSKTLCGLMIDFGQVIMLTFANALREIAAGNIIELFGLNKFNAFSGSQDPATNGIDHWDIALASMRSEEHTSELQSQFHLVCRLLLEKNSVHPYMHQRTHEKTKHHTFFSPFVPA